MALFFFTFAFLFAIYFLGSLVMFIPIFVITFFLSVNKKTIIYFSYENKILLFIFCVGLFSSIIRLGDIYSTSVLLRDCFYYLQPVIYLWFGGVISSYWLDNDRLLLKYIVVFIAFISTYSMYPLFINPSIMFHVSYDSEITLGNSVSVIGFALLYYSNFFNYKIIESKSTHRLFQLLFTITVIFSFSRTTLMLLLITFLIPHILQIKIRLIVYWLLVAVVFFVLFGGLLVDVGNSDMQDKSYINKISQSLSEMTVREISGISMSKQYWRAHEAYLGLQKFYEGSFYEFAFGQGLGSLVYTPSYIFFEENQLDILPIFHNAYINLLLKTGVVGFISYLVFLFRLLNVNIKDKSSKNRLYGTMVIYLGCSLFLVTLVTHGVYKTNINFLMLISLGFSIHKIREVYE